MLSSSGGTTAEAIIRACAEGRLRDVVPALVIAPTADTEAIQDAIARCGFLPENVVVIKSEQFPTPEEFGESILRECRQRGVDFIAQHAWMPDVPSNLLEAYEGMMAHSYHGPLDPGRPDFGGRDMFGRRVHAARLEYLRLTRWERMGTEITIQRVHPEFCQGAVVFRQDVPIEERSWTPDRLVQAFTSKEPNAWLTTLQSFASQKVVELQLEEPLIPPENIPLLEKARALAIRDYPNG